MKTLQEKLSLNLTKARGELREFQRIYRLQKGTHAPYTNWFVESCRHAPYAMGHIYAIGLPILVVIAVWGWLV